MSETRRTVLDDRYDVVRPLGSGGMGEVYLARDRVLGRDVALKVLRRQYAGDDEFAERFKREAMSAASLSHPNIVQVYDRGETEEGASYIAMEYVPGGTLKERISREGPLEAADAAGVVAQVAGALGAAHDRGMVHRDVKPQNVLLTARGGAKVADFGIARAGSSATISRTGSVLGTAGYMSPEQALGKPATPKSDLYSLGVVLYEALTGELPYTADNPIAVSMKHVNEPLRPPIELNPRIPRGMNAIVTKLLAKDPEDRYADADVLAEDLWRVNRGLKPVSAGVLRKREQITQRNAPASQNVTNKMHRPRPGPVAYRRRRRLPWLLIALAAILFTLGTLGGVQAVLGPDATAGWFDVFQGEQRPPGQPAGQVEVPEVDGLPRSLAQKRLTDAGLAVGQVSSFPSDSVAAGRVIEPGIAAGTPVDPGTDVNLTISSGAQPSSSASSSASAQSSPEPGASASATSSASARPTPRENRQAAGTNGPEANGPNGAKPKVKKSPSAQKQNSAAPTKEPADNSGGQGRGRGRGRSGESGED
ncbi:MAG TPA: Stk1 family PASTA domain-containing Ser/Thr kinase [Rubrobacter sp.]|nr:Stk1 family PASTA domain-containing Ser/Thr kinase [Rubrobacter sp.]